MSKADIEVAAAVNKLFRRLPALMGFSVQQVLEHELVLADVETDLWPARSQSFSARSRSRFSTSSTRSPKRATC